MAIEAAARRRSSRERRQSISLQAEQESELALRLHQRDEAAGLLLSMDVDLPDDDENEAFIAAADSEDESDPDEEDALEEEADDSHWQRPAQLRAPPPIPGALSIGRAHHLRADATPFQCLQLFLSPVVVGRWAVLTNAAGAHERLSTTANELFAFIGVHVFMGYDRLPELHAYWAEDSQHSFVTSLFSRNRFKQIARNLTISEPEADAAARNPISRVRELVAVLNRKFKRHWSAGRYIALDESMVAFKGRSDIKQFVPGKPHPHGFKIWALASENYMLHLEVYEGKSNAASAHGPIHDMVLRLTLGFQNNNHVLFCDSLFTSPTLAATLMARGIRICGSVRRNRKGMPTAVEMKEFGVDALERGQHVQVQKDDLTLCAWRDQKLMLVLYNHTAPHQSTSMRRWGDSGERYELPCPTAIRDYFLLARSVDVVNQLHYSYSTGRKSRRCWSRLVWWLIDICIVNAFKLWHTQNPHGRQLDFRRTLAKELAACMPANQRPQRHSPQAPRGVALAKDHYTEQSEAERDCVVCSRQPNRRKRTRYICHTCQVHMCMGDCFSQHHT